MKYYYINQQNEEDGPHDLVTMMRRIRSGVVQPDTLICLPGADPIPAHLLNDLAPFFNHPVENIRQELSEKKSISLPLLLAQGWQFTNEHMGMSVFAGACLLFSLLFIMLMDGLVGVYGGVTGGWLLFCVLQSFMFAVSLRLYRGQKASLEFVEGALSDAAPRLCFLSVITAILTPVGLAFFIVPGLFILLLGMILPLVMLDHQCGLKKALRFTMHALKKLDKQSIISIFLLLAAYTVCIAVMVPIPVIMPLMASVVCHIYEDIASA